MSKVDNMPVDRFAEWKILNQKAGAIEEEISKRIDYIIRKIHEIYGYHVLWWDYPGDGSRGEGGSINSSIHDFTNDIDFALEINNKSGVNSEIIAIINNYEYRFESSFPKRWLFENFEDELIEGRSKFLLKKKEKEELACQKKQAKKLAKEKEKILAEQVEKKLSREELEILKRNYEK